MDKWLWIIIIGLLIFAYFKYVPEETKEKINSDIKGMMSNTSEKKYLGKVTIDCSDDLQCQNVYSNESVCENGGCYQ